MSAEKAPASPDEGAGQPADVALEGQGSAGPVPPVSLGHIGKVLALLPGAMIIIMMIVTTVDVVGRYFFNKPLFGAFEVTEILMGLTIFAGMPFATAAREQITVNFLESVLSVRARRIQAGFADLVCAAVSAVMAWRIYQRGAVLIDSHEVTLQLGINRGLIASAMAVLMAIAAIVFVAAAVVAFRSAASPGKR